MIDINWGLVKNDIQRRIHRDFENNVSDASCFKTGATLWCRSTLGNVLANQLIL